MQKEEIRNIITAVAEADTPTLWSKKKEILHCLWDYYDMKCKDEKDLYMPRKTNDWTDWTLSGLGTMVCNGEH